MDIVKKLVEKYKQVKQKSADVKQFHQMLLDGVSDGTLTKEEIESLESKKEDLGLTDNDIKKFKANAYLAAFQACKADGVITAQEKEELDNIQKYLVIPDSEIIKTKEELHKLRLINEIQNGNVPEVQVINLVKQKNERIYWSEASSLLEEKVIKQGYVGRSQGFSFRVAKGVTYRVGSSKGQLVTQTGIVPVSIGDFIITSSRLNFKGSGKSFAIKFDKILGVDFYSNGLRISEANKVNPRLVQFAFEGNKDIIGAIISHSINNANC